MDGGDVGEGDVIPYRCSTKVPEFTQRDGGSPKFIAVLHDSFDYQGRQSLLSVFGSFRYPGLDLVRLDRSFRSPGSSGCSKFRVF